ncbi:BnaA09g53370D [Brassica napus]|uniref:BnaA09g53370D protein n=1 Tax=Brassica napus TaxID=3708 RepID=A0A078ILY4_BRANA|nr:BnaA09g53370D [Brassica napus]
MKFGCRDFLKNILIQRTKTNVSLYCAHLRFFI